MNASIRKMDQIMLQEGIAPMAVFKKADINNDGVIVFAELKQMFTHYLKDTTLATKDIMAAMKAFDTNKNGKIDQKEFLDVFT
jgi:Ca2+-binding EF-hand superfamily protein